MTIEEIKAQLKAARYEADRLKQVLEQRKRESTVIRFTCSPDRLRPSYCGMEMVHSDNFHDR